MILRSSRDVLCIGLNGWIGMFCVILTALHFEFLSLLYVLIETMNFLPILGKTEEIWSLFSSTCLKQACLIWTWITPSTSFLSSSCTTLIFWITSSFLRCHGFLMVSIVLFFCFPFLFDYVDYASADQSHFLLGSWSKVLYVYMYFLNIIIPLFCLILILTNWYSLFQLHSKLSNHGFLRKP